MRSHLAVTTAASDLQILTVAELRLAAGVADSSQDTALAAIGLNVAAAIMAACSVSVGSGAEPTLKKEQLTETFFKVDTCELVLSRRHNVTVVSLTQDGAALSPSEYSVDSEAGILVRLSSGVPTKWCASSVVVVYDAGFETLPSDLKLAASEYVRSIWLSRDRDPLVKSEKIVVPDVRETQREFWVGAVPGSGGSGPVPDAIAAHLQRFRNWSVW